jgi:DNA-binding MarR family transcriptional regulator
LSFDYRAAMSKDRPGYELPLLLAGAFRALVDELHVELAKNGHADARPIHGFALQAIGPEGTTISELGRRLGVSKQAAAKTAAALERIGYADSRSDPSDGRARILIRTAKAEEMLALSAEVFDRLRRDWTRQLGSERLGALEDDLRAIAGSGGGIKLGDLYRDGFADDGPGQPMGSLPTSIHAFSADGRPTRRRPLLHESAADVP